MSDGTNGCYPDERDGTPVYFVDDINSDDERSDPELYSASSAGSRSADTLASHEVHGEYFFLHQIFYWSSLHRLFSRSTRPYVPRR
jgi:hypothetical protein